MALGVDVLDEFQSPIFGADAQSQGKAGVGKSTLLVSIPYLRG